MGLLLLLCFFSDIIFSGYEKKFKVYENKLNGYENKFNQKTEDNENNCNKEEDKKEKPPEIGNFALPTSQQIAPLFSFGQNVIEKNQKQFFLFADGYMGAQRHFIDAIPGILYQATDTLSIFLNVPYAPEYKDSDNKSYGIEDVFCQFEYAYYVHSTNEYADQATIVAYSAFPTGSAQKNPPTGYGAMSYFLGTTYSRAYIDWIFFTSYGVVWPAKKDGIQFGNNYLYQFGIAKNICSIKSELILDWMLELDGTFYERNKVNNMINPDSGGNLVFLTPSIWFSREQLILQFGVGVPIAQKWFGQQNKFGYLLIGNFGWTF